METKEILNGDIYPKLTELHSYSFFVSGTAPELYPTTLFFGLFRCLFGEKRGIPKMYPFCGSWGMPVSTVILNDNESSVPVFLDLVYLSLVEKCFYSVEQSLPIEKWGSLLSEGNIDGNMYEYLVVGMAPYGGVAVWAHGFKKASLVAWLQAEETQVDMKDFMPLNPNVSLDENCDFYINNDPAVKKNLETNGLPPRNLYEKYMQQFTYRYQVLFGKWKEEEEKWEEYGEDETIPELDSLEEMLFDGTHDKMNDGRLLKFHEAGKPKKLAVKWHIKKKQYAAYFWFHDKEIKGVFGHFYGPHPETKTDFMIRIDADKNKYELVMYRYGLKEPYVLPENSYELIVFRNKFEVFRSDNYCQQTGAWIW